jgi:mycothiol synthase
MKTIRRAYRPDTDYLGVRQFLIDTFALYGYPHNWLIDRWNFCRYAVIPMHSYYNVRYFGVPTRPIHSFRDELPDWEAAVGVWENERGEIVALVHSENEEAGEAWTQMHPDYTFLYPEMVDYAEERLADRVDRDAFLKIYLNDGSALEEAVRARGYRKLGDSLYTLEHTLQDLAAPQLPEGFAFRTVREEDDVDKRRQAKAIAFGGGYAPSDWAPADVYREIQRAPDYRPELDLFIVAPNGDYASFCTIWIDEANHHGIFEPVGTRLEYQGQGLGRALLMEGLRRMAERGVTRSYMDSAIPFYLKVGFTPTPYSRSAWIKSWRI